MKTFAKTSGKLISLQKLVCLIILSVLFISCTNDETEHLANAGTFDKLKFDLQTFNSFKEKKSKNEIVDKVSFNSNLSKKEGGFESFMLRSSEVNADNLNHLFTSLPISVDILAVTIATDTVNNASGILIHSIKEDGTLQLEAFKKDQIDDAYSNMKFPAKIVNAYKLDNVLFISKNLFPNHDLETLAVSDISTTPHNSIYDDVALLAFTVNNKQVQIQIKNMTR